MKTLKICPHKGFEDVAFGMTITKIQEILGKPDDLTTETYEDGVIETILEYEALSVDLSFTSADENKLGGITFYGENCVLYDIEFIGIKEDDFFSIIEELEIDDLFLADEIEEMNTKEYFSDSKGISFWLQNSKIDSITIFPAHDEDDNPVWL